MGAAYFGERGAVGAEDGFAPLHGFNDGEPETFGDGGKQQCGAVGVEPTALRVGDNAEHGYIGVVVELRAELGGIFGRVVAGDDEVVVGEVVHKREKSMDVLLFLDFTKGKEEGHMLRVELGGHLLGTEGEVFDGVVDDARGFASEVDNAGGVFFGKA